MSDNSKRPNPWARENILVGVVLPEPVLIATCGPGYKLYKTVDPGPDDEIVFKSGRRIPGPLGYIERDGRKYPEEPVLTITKMMPYWDFLDERE